jgi:DNA-directed RNA polymerase subunit beta'
VDENGKTVKAKIAGLVRLPRGAGSASAGEKNQIIVVHESDLVKEYVVSAALSLLVKDGDLVIKGQRLTEGNLSPNQIMQLRGTEEAQKYVVKEVQDIYVSQGQNIHDKHIEVIVRQMFSKMRLTDSGDSEFTSGEIADKAKFNYINEELQKSGKRPATADQLLMGITKVSLNTESFLAAASFQETTRVLIEAAVTGKTDYLRGLKENVIIGKLIPAGTGYTDEIARQNLEVKREAVVTEEVAEVVAE